MAQELRREMSRGHRREPGQTLIGSECVVRQSRQRVDRCQVSSEGGAHPPVANLGAGPRDHCLAHVNTACREQHRDAKEERGRCEYRRTARAHACMRDGGLRWNLVGCMPVLRPQGIHVEWTGNRAETPPHTLLGQACERTLQAEIRFHAKLWHACDGRMLTAALGTRVPAAALVPNGSLAPMGL